MNKLPLLSATLFSACVLSLALTGCGKKEAPAKTVADVSAAQAEGAREVEDQRHEAAKDTMKAQEDLNKASAELTHEAVEGQVKVAVAKAEANHKVSIELCEGMSGDARAACKTRADDQLVVAKAQIEADARAADPKH